MSSQKQTINQREKIVGRQAKGLGGGARKTYALAVGAAVVEVDIEAVVRAGASPLHGVGPGCARQGGREHTHEGI